MKKLSLVLFSFCASIAICSAEVVYVTAMTSNCVSTTSCGSGPNFDVNLVGNYVYQDEGGYGAYTSAKAGTVDKAVVPGSRYHSNSFSNSTPDIGILISPSLAVTGGIYKVYHVFSSTAGNVSLDVTVGVTNVEGCTLSWTNTDKFRSQYGSPSPQSWQFLGYLTNNLDTSFPRIRFYFVDGVVNAGAQRRLIIEQFRFVYYDLCTDIPTVGVTGPIASNLVNVVVTGVTNATAVTVYQDSGSGFVQIGQLTSGIVDGNNSVPVTGLVKGAQVAATQTVGGQEGCVPTAGVIVGGGANPSIRIVATVRENTALTGPVGAAGSGSIVSFLGASSVLGGGAPEQGIVLQAGSNWQTISFTNTIDPLYTWAGTDPTPGTWDGPFGALDGFAIACEGDTGPYDIYFDDLANGTNGVFQNWDSAAAGTAAVGFSQPSFSGSSSANLLTAPNQSVVSDATSFSGANSCRVRFQFNGESADRWVRLVTSGATPVANPQLDVNEPISIKVLLLPPGAPLPPSPMPPPLSISVVGGQPVLSWTGSYPLQSSTNVAGPYTDVGIATGPYTVTSSEAALFYRLRGN